MSGEAIDPNYDHHSEYIDERRCPLCGRPNQCGAKNGDCWCFHTKVPDELRSRIPEERRGKACICRQCVEEFHKMSS